DSEDKIFALILRGDHNLNETKISKLEIIKAPFRFADNKTIKQHTNADPGSVGPVGLKIPIIADKSAALIAGFICGANENDQHFKEVNWERDLPEPIVADIRNVEDGDLSPDGKGKLSIARGIEVGHIFQLGDKYSQALDAKVLDENGKTQVMTMGCYGIGVSRIVAAAIEQYHDDKGIIWPESIAPFTLAIVPINMHKSDKVKEAAEKLYHEVLSLGIDVLLDDRKESPGVKFSDMELIGIPHRIVIGDRSLDKGQVEYKHRTDKDNTIVDVSETVEFIKGKITTI
ncbi:proline--tRNA ligase, partial [Moraxella sp.]|uniref:proline--tRNA ligase n=1 Tax=Moraxella sp. TaxID=479 RepID=UPI00262DCDB8